MLVPQLRSSSTIKREQPKTVEQLQEEMAQQAGLEVNMETPTIKIANMAEWKRSIQEILDGGGKIIYEGTMGRQALTYGAELLEEEATLPMRLVIAIKAPGTNLKVAKDSTLLEHGRNLARVMAADKLDIFGRTALTLQIVVLTMVEPTFMEALIEEGMLTMALKVTEEEEEVVQVEDEPEDPSQRLSAMQSSVNISPGIKQKIQDLTTPVKEQQQPEKRSTLTQRTPNPSKSKTDF